MSQHGNLVERLDIKSFEQLKWVSDGTVSLIRQIIVETKFSDDRIVEELNKKDRTESSIWSTFSCIEEIESEQQRKELYDKVKEIFLAETPPQMELQPEKSRSPSLSINEHDVTSIPWTAQKYGSEKTIKKSASMSNFGRMPRHVRQSSAPNPKSPLKTVQLKEDEIEMYRDEIQNTVPMLLRPLPRDDIMSPISPNPPPPLSPIGDDDSFVSPLYAPSSLQAAQSAPAKSARTPNITLKTPEPRLISRTNSNSLASDWNGDGIDCEETKNRALIKVIGMGKKNHMPRLLSILNDLNSRMLFEEYKQDERFYHPRDYGLQNGDTDYKRDDQQHAINIDVINEEEEESDEDVSIKYAKPYKSFLSLRDTIPLRNNTLSHRITNGAWSVLDKVPLDIALRTYHERMAAPLDFNPRYLIKDSISKYIENVALAAFLVMRLLHRSGMPLQFDVVILPKAVVKNPKHRNNMPMSPKVMNSDDDDNFSDDDSETKEEDHFDDDIGSVEERLMALPKEHHHDHLYKNKENGTIYAVNGNLTADPAADATTQMSGTAAERQRRMDIAMKKVPFMMDGMTRHGRYVCIIDRLGKAMEVADTVDEEVNDPKDAEEQKEPTSSSRPSMQRTLKRKVTVLKLPFEDEDGDESNKKSKKKKVQKKVQSNPIPKAKSNEASNSGNASNIDNDLFYFFQPPKPWGDLIDGVAMAEAMHSDTLEYLLPKKESETVPIGARHLCGGKMFCVSFHVLSKDEIKCYLYIDQKCIRLNLVNNQPLTDLMHILPHYFQDDSFEPINIRKALRKSDFGKEYTEKVIELVTTWMNQWKMHEREERLLNDLNAVELTRDGSGPPYIKKLSPLGKYVSTECKWNELDTRNELKNQFKLYLTLRDVYRMPPHESDWLSLRSNRDYGAFRRDVETPFSSFSTEDREYDEMGRKLGIIQR